MSETPQAPRAKTNWLVLGSVMLNVLLVGIIVGRYVSPAAKPPQNERVERRERSDRSPDEALTRSMLEVLPDEESRALRKELRAAWMETRDERRDARQARAELGKLILTEPFDRAALEAELVRLRGAEDVVREVIQRRVLDRLEQMSLEERRALVERLSRPQRFRERRDRDRERRE